MLRLIRLKQSNFSAEQIAQASQALQLLQKHASPLAVQLFAVPHLLDPTSSTSKLDWLSHRNGQIKPYAQLSTTEQEQLLTDANKQITSIRLLQKKLNAEGQHNQAELLTPFTAHPDTQYLYAIEGQPVLTNWVDAPAPAPIISAPINTPVAAIPVAAVAAKKRGCLWPLLLLLLLLLLLGALAWWWFNKPSAQTTHAPINTTEIAEPTEPVSQNFGAKFACQAKEAEPPEFTIIFDTSHSMTLNIDITQAEEVWYYSMEATTEEELEKERSLEQGTSRFSVAKDAMKHMINDLHKQIPVQLLTFETCGDVTNHGVFSAKRRTDLLSTLLGLEPRGGTPSGEALYIAAQQMNGVDKDGMIVLVIDGEDGCGVDICQVADSIAQSKPRIRVNVVDITGFGLSNCVAEKTGGRVYSSNNIEQINAMMRSSIEEVATNPNCHD